MKKMCKKMMAAGVAAGVLLMMASSCVSKSERFEAVADIEGVQALSVGSAVTGLANVALKSDRSGKDDKEAGDMSRYMKSIDNIEIVNCENEVSVDEVRRKCDSIIAVMDYLPVRSRTEGDVKVRIYTGPAENEESDGIILTEDGGGSYQLVYVSGKVDMKKLLREFAE